MEENEKLHKIRAEIEKAKQEKQQAERQLVRAENRLKYREQKGKNTQIDSAWCGYGTVFSRTERVIGSTAWSDDGASGYQCTS